MKISKYTKLHDGFYKLSLENKKSVKLHEDLILKNDLLLKKEIDDDLLFNLEKENLNYEAYTFAIKYISIKLRTKLEINKYLLKKGIGDSRVEEVIKKLESQGYLNEDVYAKSFINDRINLSSDGPLKIKKELIINGINSIIIDKYIEIFDNDLEITRINRIINKLSKSNKKSNYQFKVKMKLYLNNLGYNSSNINYCLDSINVDEEQLKKQEYDKLYRKYSKKYNNDELEYKIKQSLYVKGFR